jgi:RNA-binding protein YhbY
VGKGGVNENMVKQIAEALEARELIKVSVLQNCEDGSSICLFSFDSLYSTIVFPIVCTNCERLPFTRAEENRNIRGHI